MTRTRARLEGLEGRVAATRTALALPDGSRVLYTPGEAHALTVALRTATNLEDLQREHGTMMGFFVGEDEIMRGVRERPGPPVEWDEDGTTCS